jgi:antitoxin (DNA-binding transcriptional repressor) of toxin-antitoxin stability system
MTSVGSYAAKTHLPKLLERVAQGERIVITRRGVPVAMLTQPPRPAAQDVRGVLTQLKALRRGNTLGTRSSVRDLIEEGRRF